MVPQSTGRHPSLKFEITIDDQSLALDIKGNNGQIFLTSELGESILDVVELQPGVYSVLMNHQSFVVAVENGSKDRIVINGTPFTISLLDAVHLHLRDLGWESVSEKPTGQIVTQIPGLITKIFHKVGDEVGQDEPLFLMEAMKMENEIRAPISGTITRIHVNIGQTVDKGTMIIEIG
jgi:pyruvate carboxylase subunit B